MKTSRWEKFERDMLGVAALLLELKACEGDHRPPSEIVRDLKIIDKALTVALQSLIPLRLEHQEDRDIMVKPFNWPVVQSLSQARTVLLAKRGETEIDSPAYPTELLIGLKDLRDSARKAIELESSGRGNSPRRNPTSARKADLAKVLVFRYRSTFGHVPPVSHTGLVVDLMHKMLVSAGEGDGEDANELLRVAIERDRAGHELLPNGRAVRSAQRVK